MSRQEVEAYRGQLLTVRKAVEEAVERLLKTKLPLDASVYSEEEVDAAYSKAVALAKAAAEKYGEAMSLYARQLAIGYVDDAFNPTASWLETSRIGEAGGRLLVPEAENGAARFAADVAAIVGSSIWRAANAAAVDDELAEYVLVPSGAETCAFCLMVASNGPLPLHGSGRWNAGSYLSTLHDHCDCIVMKATDSRLDDYYAEDLPKYQEMYERANGLATERYTRALRRETNAWQQPKENRASHGHYKSAGLLSGKQQTLKAYRDLYGLK